MQNERLGDVLYDMGQTVMVVGKGLPFEPMKITSFEPLTVRRYTGELLTVRSTDIIPADGAERGQYERMCNWPENFDPAELDVWIR